jgi:hypothetical protein
VSITGTNSPKSTNRTAWPRPTAVNQGGSVAVLAPSAANTPLANSSPVADCAEEPAICATPSVLFPMTMLASAELAAPLADECGKLGNRRVLTRHCGDVAIGLPLRRLDSPGIRGGRSAARWQSSRNSQLVRSDEDATAAEAGRCMYHRIDSCSGGVEGKPEDCQATVRCLGRRSPVVMSGKVLSQRREEDIPSLVSGAGWLLDQ